MLRSTIHALLILANLFACNLVAQEAESERPKISSESAEKSRALLKKFVDNAEEFKRYSCAMLVQRTTDNLKVAGASESVEEWFIHSFDSTVNIRRQDQIIPTVSIALVPDFTRFTLFVTDESVAQVNGSRVFSVNSKDVDSENDWQGLFDQSYFDPFTVPICGSAVMNISRVRLPMPDRVMWMAKNADPVQFEEEARFTGVEVCVSSKYQVYDRILFGKKSGDMPIQFTRVIREKGYYGTVEKADTSWRCVNDRWYPEKVSTELRLGNPASPSTSISRRITMFWAFDDEVPQGIFVVGNSDWSAEAVRDYLVATAEKR